MSNETSSLVIIANGAAYGQESLFNALRLSIALKEQQTGLDLRLFLMSDAVIAGLNGQQPREGYNLQQMLEILTAQNVPVKLCKTCADARGISGLALVDGVEIGTLGELAQWTLAAEKVLTF
ncbi:DsrE/DsrF/TusD sulfur relay family protein [Yersinia canariae]|uniref:DsrE/DsrF/TusD sulfur relay family protein n=1 Tax=Yersinia canariae TaxID=2607663 RepID=UPI0011A3693F|nr:DsrE/DsrF/TusD sulfur relay family protein [Yersinia canariae]